MSRSESDLLEDIANAIIASDRTCDTDHSRKASSWMRGDEATSAEPATRWRQIAGMRDVLAHHYFATHPEIIQATIDKDLDPLEGAVVRMRSKVESEPGNPEA